MDILRISKHLRSFCTIPCIFSSFSMAMRLNAHNSLCLKCNLPKLCPIYFDINTNRMHPCHIIFQFKLYNIANVKMVDVEYFELLKLCSIAIICCLCVCVSDETTNSIFSFFQFSVSFSLNEHIMWPKCFVCHGNYLERLLNKYLILQAFQTQLFRLNLVLCGLQIFSVNKMDFELIVGVVFCPFGSTITVEKSHISSFGRTIASTLNHF